MIKYKYEIMKNRERVYYEKEINYINNDFITVYCTS